MRYEIVDNKVKIEIGLSAFASSIDPRCFNDLAGITVIKPRGIEFLISQEKLEEIIEAIDIAKVCKDTLDCDPRLTDFHSKIEYKVIAPNCIGITCDLFVGGSIVFFSVKYEQECLAPDGRVVRIAMRAETLGIHPATIMDAYDSLKLSRVLR